MELRHIQYFVAVAEELHFGRAARRLNMAQPPLSQRVKDLERELGVRLFDRSRRGTTITESGALFLEHARRVLAEVEAARDAMHRVRALESGRLALGVPPDTPSAAVTAIHAQFDARRPHIRLDLREHTSTEQMALLAEGKLDAGLVRHPAEPDHLPGHRSGEELELPLGVLLPAAHPRAADARVALRDLGSAPLIIFQRSMAPLLYDMMLATCRYHGYLPAEIRHARNPDLVDGLVLAGRGVHFVERRPYVPDGLTWRPLAGDPLAWRTSLIWHPNHASPPLADLAAAVSAGLRAAGYR
ncbi:MAG TPA: LysR substrate-binding domain-containing protein [Streptosporangiaceae bacterium]